MSCARCGGTVVLEEFLDDKGSSLGFEGQRCLNCGHIEDSVIHANRGGADFPSSRHIGLIGGEGR
jgi:uncharacterized Zn finger protein